MRLVVIPQAMRLITPPLTSQYLNIVKNSSLAVFIGYPDLVQIFAGTVLNQTQAAVQVMAITMGVYLVISLAVAFALNAYNARHGAEGALTLADASLAYVRTAPEPTLPAPIFSRGAFAWTRDNLFSSWTSGALTLILLLLCLWLIPPLIEWATVRAVWSAPDGALCRAHQDGACWAFIAQKIDYFRYGSYPQRERWRVDLTEAIGAVLIAWLAWPRAPRRDVGAAPVLRRLSDPRLRAVARFGLARPAGRRDGAVGRRLRVAAHRAGRHRVFAAARRAAGARAPLAAADRQARQRRLHRIRARRALRHRAVHGQFHAAAVPAGKLDARPLAALAGRHGAVRRRLYGGGSARRAAVDQQGPVRGRDGARPQTIGR